jgi:hypothetical protein
MLVNHFHPNAIPAARIVSNPRSHHDYRTNLRKLQEGLVSLEIRNIGFDLFKVSEMNYAENWNLICKLHRQFGDKDKPSVISDGKWSVKQPESRADSTFGKTPLGPLMPINPLSTPMKGPKLSEEGGKIRWQTMNTIEEIKRIVTVERKPDRLKVEQLKDLLGLGDDDGAESECDLKDLLSDYKKKQEVIQID